MRYFGRRPSILGKRPADTTKSAPVCVPRDCQGYQSDGHDAISCALLYRKEGDTKWAEVPMAALGNGYLGMRGCPEEGGPNAENGTFINGFYETRPIVYGEDAYGFARTGQTICNVTDSKIIKLFVDDEPFWLSNAHLLKYDRRLNMKSGTLDREILWETPAGKQVSITSRRLVSFANRHVAAISYRVMLLNAAAPVVISSEMKAAPRSAAANSSARLSSPLWYSDAQKTQRRQVVPEIKEHAQRIVRLRLRRRSSIRFRRDSAR